MNGRPVVEYLGYNPAYVAAVRDPLEILGLEGTYDVIVKASGGGVMGQAEAARLGISRALVEADAANRPPLKAEGFMTRDPRAVERKKYGLRKARKAGQYSKR
jgi:small subunit ribosomal protein S9